MKANRFSFSRQALNNLEPPETGKRHYYYDTKTHGLCLAVSPTGNKTFLVYRKIQGKPERITLGRYPDLSLEHARAQAHTLNAAIAEGRNPNEERREAKAEWTLSDLFERYLEQYAKPHKRSWKEDQAQFRRYLAETWGGHKLSSLRRDEIQALHTRLGEDHGHYAANRLLSLLHTLFDKAREWGWKGENPARGIKKFREKSRERFLRAEELPRLFRALEQDANPDIRDYVLLALLTGARKSNLLAMRWEEIHLEREVWEIPLTKNGGGQTVPLMAEAREILRRRRRADPGGEFVFPGRGRSGHLQEPKKAWQRILERADLKDLRLHDLRRSLGSWQAATGANQAIIGKTLNHRDMKSTAIYTRLDLDPVRRAMETATRAIWDAARSSPPEE